MVTGGQGQKVIISRRYNKRSQNPVTNRGETQQLDALSYRLQQAEKHGGGATNERSMLNVTVAGSSAIQ